MPEAGFRAGIVTQPGVDGLRALYRVLLILPWAVPYVAAALIWGWMFDFEFGVLNYLVQASGM